MNYRIELIDPAGRIVATYGDVPLMELTREGPDGRDRIRGLIPETVVAVGPGYRLRAFVDEALFCEAPVVRTGPMWSDTRKLILEDYVYFHEVMEVEALGTPCAGNSFVEGAYINRRVGDIVRDVINRAPGAIHYTVDHGEYPDGAMHEFEKFQVRAANTAALPVGGIDSGQWVAADRIDASGATVTDGNTIAGLVVDGIAWPDLRLMMIDVEQVALNDHAVLRHPEVADWSGEDYARSIYRQRAQGAKAALQDLLDTHGISHVELNPHRDGTGAHDGRVDPEGRYLGLVFGGGQCFNAAQVETGAAEVLLHGDGRQLDLAMALKDFYSYAGAHSDSVETANAVLAEFDVAGGVTEVLAALAYAAGGFVFEVSTDLSVRFRKPVRADSVYFYDPLTTGVQFGSDATALVNRLTVSGNPLAGPIDDTHEDEVSIARYGVREDTLDFFSLKNAGDAAHFAAGLLRDLAWPAPAGVLLRYAGDATLQPGQLLAFRGDAFRRIDPLPGEAWGRAFSEEMIARVESVTHRLTGKMTRTEAVLTSPLRSVRNPLAFITRDQDSAARLFGLRLDEVLVGLDTSFHLD